MIRITLTAIFFAAVSASALAQSTTATTGVTKPTEPVAGGSKPIGQLSPPKVQIRPAARSGESGLRVGEGAATGEPVEVKRLK